MSLCLSAKESVVESQLSKIFSITSNTVESEISLIEDQEVLSVSTSERSRNPWDANLTTKNITPIRKGDVVAIRFKGRRATEANEAGLISSYFTINTSAKGLPSPKYYLLGEWQEYLTVFEAPSGAAANELNFQFQVGQQPQSLQIKEFFIENFGDQYTPEELTGFIKPASFASGFEGAFYPIPSSSTKGVKEGAISPVWKTDFGGWADIDIVTEQFSDNAYEGDNVLRITQDRVGGGYGQILLPLPVSSKYFAKLSMAVRSPTQTPITLGWRKGAPPWSQYFERSISTMPEWRKVEYLVPPSMADAGAQINLMFKAPGIFEIDDVSITYHTQDEIGTTADLDGNILLSSSFPDGLHAPFAPYSDHYRKENYQTDPDVVGPTGINALRIQPVKPGNTGMAAVRFPFVGKMGAKHTFSFYAKAETAGQNIAMRMGPVSEKLFIAPYSKDIKLTTEWQRFEFTLELPYTSDSHYMAHIFNWGPTRVFWIDGLQMEVADQASPFQRTGQVEAVLLAESDYAVHFVGEPIQLNASIFGDIEPGMQLKTTLLDVYDNETEGPLVPLPSGEALVQFSFEALNENPDQLGSWNLLYEVVDASGKSVSKTNEIILHRVREPREYDSFVQDSVFGLHLNENSDMPRVARKIGFTWARMFGLDWQFAEKTPGDWNFDNFDYKVNQLHEARLNILGIMGRPPMHARSFKGHFKDFGLNNWHAANSRPEDLDAWKNYTFKLAERYKGKINAWETWNEPFLPGFSNEGAKDGKFIHSPAERFIEVHIAAKEGILEGNPEATILFNGGAHYGNPSDVWTQDMFELGIMDHVDHISYHKYTASGVGFKGDRLGQAIKAHRDLMGEDSEASEIWNSESGSGGGDVMNFYKTIPPLGKREETSYWVDFMIRSYVSNVINGGTKYFIYSWHSFGTWTGNYSMHNADGRLFPSSIGLSNLAWHIEGKKYKQTIDLGEEVSAHLFEGGGNSAAVILSKGAGRVTAHALPAEYQLSDAYGNPAALPLTLGNAPVFINAPGAALPDFAKNVERITAKNATFLPPSKPNSSNNSDAGDRADRSSNDNQILLIALIGLLLLTIIIVVVAKRSNR